MQLGLFITLDNTLITTRSGRTHALHSEDWKFISETIYAIKDYYDKGYKIFIICNQFQISQGFTPKLAFVKKLEDIIETIEKDLKLKKNSISYDYNIEEGLYRTLPNPGIIYELATDFEIDVVNSILIGSCYADKHTAINSGIKNYITVTDLVYN
jgi:histidinol phosphatase-like enzyme